MQAGSEYGYKLLFVVLLAGLFAIYMQVRALMPPLEGFARAAVNPVNSRSSPRASAA